MDKKVDLSKMFVKLADYDDAYNISYSQFVDDVADRVIEKINAIEPVSLHKEALEADEKAANKASKKKVSKKKTSSKKTVNSLEDKLD